MTDFAPLPEILDRIEAVLRGEGLPASAAVEAGKVPAYYGDRDPCEAWLTMRRRMGDDDAAFYEAGAIGWASR